MAMADNKEHDTTSSKEGEAWGTLEELLLACAISRHGTSSWDFIAVELQKRATSNKTTSNNFLKAFTPRNCEQRYHALKCRFDVTGGGGRNDNDDDGQSEGENDVAGERDLREKLPLMIDELRKLRVAELRREVERHDVSIVSLRSKVRRLEEERGRSSLKAEDEADLRTGADRSNAGDERRGRGPGGSSVEEAGKSVSREPSDEPEDRSLDESKSTSHRTAQVKESNRTGKPNVIGNGEPEPDPVRSALEFEPDREFSAEKVVGRTSQPVRIGNPGELRASVSESKREIKESEVVGDVQSSGSLQKKKRRGWRRSNGVGSSRNENEVASFSPANERMDEKSQPLIKFLEILRSHKHGLVFQRRLPSQETQKYKKLIRQHMDVETVKSKLEQGIYSDCHPMFYRDLLLIFTNALLFFPKSSTQHLAARELRRLVTKEIAARKPDPVSEPQVPDPDAKKENTPSSSNIVVCRRRRYLSSITQPKKVEELEAAENINVEHRKKASNGKDTPMKLKRERSNLRISNNDVNNEGNDVKRKKEERRDEEDEQEQAMNVNNKRMKQSSPSKEGERAKVVDVGKKKVVAGKKMDEGPRTRFSGRRSMSTTAKKKPRR